MNFREHPEQIEDPLLAYMLAEAEKPFRDMLAEDPGRSSDEIFAFGVRAGIAATSAYVTWQEESSDTFSNTNEVPTLKKIGDATVVSIGDLYDFGKTTLRLEPRQIRTVVRAWRSLERHQRDSKGGVDPWSSSQFIFDLTEFFGEEEAHAAGLPLETYLNIDKMYEMTEGLLTKYSRAPSTFHTGVRDFGIGSIVFWARFLNHHMQSEPPLLIPAKFRQ